LVEFQEPRSRGLPAGLLAQPFYDWNITRNEFAQPASAGLLVGGFSQMLKALDGKHAEAR
jgi:hypothetical protein